MKKALALLLALTVVGFVFAEDAAYTLTGSASLVWGYNLNNNQHGFTNSAAASLTVPFVAKQAKTAGEEAITGSITITDFEMNLRNDSGEDGDPAITGAHGDVTAKILFPSKLYLAIASAPSFEVNNAQTFSPWANDDYADKGVVTPSIDSNGGFTFGMDGDFNFALLVGSTNAHDYAAAAAVDGTITWEHIIADGTEDLVADLADGIFYVDTTTGTMVVLGPLTDGQVYLKGTAVEGTAAGAAATNQYVAGVNVGYTVADLMTIAANAIMGPFGAATQTIGAGVKVTVEPKDSGLKAVLGADLSMVDPVTGFDVSGTVDYTMADVVTVGAGAYFGKASLDVDASKLDAMARLSLLAVPNLTAKVGVDVLDLIANPANDPMLLQVGFNLGYKVMIDDANYINPYFNGGFQTAGANNESALIIDAGVSAMLFPKTVFTLGFAAGDFVDNEVTGATGYGDADKGILTFTTKITF